jgi:hypothetical protein
MELKGQVWEFLRMRKVPEGTAIVYRTVEEGEWNLLKARPRWDWPMYPDAVRCRDAQLRRENLRRGVWAGVALLALLGASTEGFRWMDVARRIQTVKTGSGDAVIFVGHDTGSRELCIERLNALRTHSKDLGLVLHSFEWHPGVLRLNFVSSNDVQVRKAFAAAGIPARKEGATWVVQN